MVELAEDATTSSEATNSTRRASAGSNLPASPYPQSHSEATDLDLTDPPSTPPGEEIQVPASPVHQRELHKKRRRKSSGIPPMNFNNPDDYSSSPGSSIGSDDSHESFVTAEGDIIDGSDSDEDRDLVAREETITGIDNDDTTSHSIASAKSNDNSSTSSSGRLDEALRQASRQAGTQGIEHDEHGELTMEIADDEVTNAFKPLVAQTAPKAPMVRNLSSLQDQENVNPFSPAFKANLQSKDNDDNEEEMTMDVTRAIGSILPPVQEATGSPKRGRRKSIAPARKRSSAGRRRSSGESSILADETMEFTMAFGSIQQDAPAPILDTSASSDVDEDMTMEFTSIVGGVVDYQGQDPIGAIGDSQPIVSSLPDADDDDAMDITTAMGGVLSPVTERTEPSENETMGMDFTKAVGAILPNDLRTNDKTTAKMLMEEEVDHGQLTRSPFTKHDSQDCSQDISPTPKVVTASEAGSPSLIIAQSRNSRRSAGSRASTTPKQISRHGTPVKKPATPSKQLTPKPERPTTPSKTPPSKNVSMRRSSPKRLFKAEIKKVASETPKTITPSLHFKEDITNGLSMPSVVLTPRARRPSGVGVDQEGLGSPRVAALLDRRTSIGESAASFTPQNKPTTGVRFDDPRALEDEIDRDRAEQERRESGRAILQMEVDTQEEEQKDTTATLRDMIQSLTPKKNKLRGRKSLHVGAAKGLLGKRPAELDVEDEDEDATPKRLKGMERSPVKGVHLPAPPSKSETTGRLGNAPRFSLGNITGNISTPVTQSFPGKEATTPKDQARFKDVDAVKSNSKPPVSFNEQLAGVPVDPEPAEEEDRIHLQDFLNMTSIRFMELTTTKRRHTIIPSKDDDKRLSVHAGDDRELASCVVAGACTVPMLELYQHVRIVIEIMGNN